MSASQTERPRKAVSESQRATLSRLLNEIPARDTSPELMQLYCKIIWGPGDLYEFEVQTDDWEFYYWTVEKTEDGRSRPLSMTPHCRGKEAAWKELARMLRIWAIQAATGKPLTKEQRLAIFGGPRGEYRALLEGAEAYRPREFKVEEW